jgi:hypothetical protein
MSQHCVPRVTVARALGGRRALPCAAENPLPLPLPRCRGRGGKDGLGRWFERKALYTAAVATGAGGTPAVPGGGGHGGSRTSGVVEPVRLQL